MRVSRRHSFNDTEFPFGAKTHWRKIQLRSVSDRDLEGLSTNIMWTSLR